jgi:hypothetical protein
MYTPTEELINQLDQRYGNPHATDCKLIQQAIVLLKEQDAHIKELEKFIAIPVLTEAQNK